MAPPPTEFTPEPDLILGEDSLGHQRSSMRPSSAKYSFGRGSRSGNLREGAPGPGTYSPLASCAPAAFFGTGPQITPVRACQYGEADGANPAPNPEYVEQQPARAVFGTAARDSEVVDPELVRICPESRYGKAGPGLIYTPNYRSASCGPRKRPQSAPSYSMRGRTSATTSQVSSGTPETVAPNSYAPPTASIGAAQCDSRRRSSRCSSFGRASRFGPTREAQGQVSAECASAKAMSGSSCQTGVRRHRRAPSATFGSASRESSARARQCHAPGDRGPRANLGPPRMPHPTVPLHKDIVKWS